MLHVRPPLVWCVFALVGATRGLFDEGVRKKHIFVTGFREASGDCCVSPVVCGGFQGIRPLNRPPRSFGSEMVAAVFLDPLPKTIYGYLPRFREQRSFWSPHGSMYHVAWMWPIRRGFSSCAADRYAVVVAAATLRAPCLDSRRACASESFAAHQFSSQTKKKEPCGTWPRIGAVAGLTWTARLRVKPVQVVRGRRAAMARLASELTGRERPVVGDDGDRARRERELVTPVRACASLA